MRAEMRAEGEQKESRMTDLRILHLIIISSHKDRQIDIQTDDNKQADRQTDSQTDQHTNRQTDKQTE